MKALVGIDGSPHSFQALRQTARLMSPTKDEIVLYFALPQGASVTNLDPQIIARGRDSLVQAVFDAAKEELPPEFLTQVSTVLGDQPARIGLIRALEDSHANILGVGARGVSTIERWLMGSVSHAVVQEANVPVLVAREHAASRDEDGYRVVVACDGSPTDELLALTLQQFTWPADTSGRIMTVVEPQFVGQVPTWLKHKVRSPETEEIALAFEREFEAEKTKLRQKLEEISRALPPAFVKLPPALVEGNPAEQILQQVVEDRADLVVVGARGLNALERFFLGSTSEKVVEQAPCSVLLVRHQERA